MSVTRRQLTLQLDTDVSKSRLVSLIVGCGDGLGGPPSDVSLQTFGRTVVLYLPKQCLLDTRVAHDAT